MNRDRLRELAAAEHIREDAYSLEGGLPLERLVLSITEGGWAVYYSERGERVGLVNFQTEDEACSYSFEQLLRDSSNRERQ